MDPTINAIIPPWGGELLVEILPLLDFERLRRAEPKWILGFSDISTLLFTLTIRTRIATAHGTNWMDLIDGQGGAIVQTHLDTLRAGAGQTITQQSFSHYQAKFTPYEVDHAALFNLDTKTCWKNLRDQNQLTIEGRGIGGCLDTLVHLVGTPYGDLPSFIQLFRSEGVVLFLENCELLPVQVVRALWQLKNAGWFDSLNGIILGRSAGVDSSEPNRLSYVEALKQTLGDLPFPILYDADFGHQPPQMILINGAVWRVSYSEQMTVLEQTLR